MKIKKKLAEEVKREDAHGGSGGRKLYLTVGELENQNFQALTYGYLPGGSKFDWHSHEGIEEVMLVLKGKGVVRDRDGEYEYSEGDFFIFPQKVEHQIVNPTKKEHEYIFVRIKITV